MRALKAPLFRKEKMPKEANNYETNPRDKTYLGFIRAKTKTTNNFSMATNRILDKYTIAIVAILAVMGTLLLIAWIDATSVHIMHTADLSITHVQFDKDYLTVTVKNQGSLAYTINEVTVSEAIVSEEGIVNQNITSHTFSVLSQISEGEQISFCMGLKWTSGYLYQIKLETVTTADFSPAALCFVKAP
jgi:hypothetical protein